MKHCTNIAYAGGLPKLAADLAELRYDALCEFLKCLTIELANDSLEDEVRGRHKLANELNRASNAISDAWAICERYMKEEHEQVEKNHLGLVGVLQEGA
jgi:hypothetical protein